jgi:hypothetical protein
MNGWRKPTAAPYTDAAAADTDAILCVGYNSAVKIYSQAAQFDLTRFLQKFPNLRIFGNWKFLGNFWEKNPKILEISGIVSTASKKKKKLLNPYLLYSRRRRDALLNEQPKQL